MTKKIEIYLAQDGESFEATEAPFKAAEAPFEDKFRIKFDGKFYSFSQIDVLAQDILALGGNVKIADNEYDLRQVSFRIFAQGLFSKIRSSLSEPNWALGAFNWEEVYSNEKPKWLQQLLNNPDDERPYQPPRKSWLNSLLNSYDNLYYKIDYSAYRINELYHTYIAKESNNNGTEYHRFKVGRLLKCVLLNTTIIAGGVYLGYGILPLLGVSLVLNAPLNYFFANNYNYERERFRDKAYNLLWNIALPKWIWDKVYRHHLEDHQIEGLIDENATTDEEKNVTLKFGRYCTVSAMRCRDWGYNYPLLLNTPRDFVKFCNSILTYNNGKISYRVTLNSEIKKDKDYYPCSNKNANIRTEQGYLKFVQSLLMSITVYTNEKFKIDEMSLPTYSQVVPDALRVSDDNYTKGINVLLPSVNKLVEFKEASVARSL
jgi:hypothetical protein